MTFCMKKSCNNVCADATVAAPSSCSVENSHNAGNFESSDNNNVSFAGTVIMAVSALFFALSAILCLIAGVLNISIIYIIESIIIALIIIDVIIKTAVNRKFVI